MKNSALFLIFFLSLTMIISPLPLCAQDDEAVMESSDDSMVEEPVVEEATPALKAGEAVQATGILQDAVTDDDGKVLYYGIWDNTDFCFVIADHGAKDKELAALAGKTVKLEGVFVKDMDGNKLITVNHFSEVKDEEPVADEPVIEEN